MAMRNWVLCILAIGLMIAFIWLAHMATLSAAYAQAGGVLPWSKPIRISGRESFAFTPFIVADQSGQLHAVWSQNDRQLLKEDLDLDTVYYSTKRGVNWSIPTDIFAVADSRSQARINRLRIDSSGRLHLVVTTWTEILYATAAIPEAGYARGWRVSRIPEPAWLADIAIGGDGVVHLVYTNQRQGVYYRQSNDGGMNWSAPVSIWLAPSEGYSAANVRIEIDERNTLHVAWGVTAAAKGWNPYGISYARSPDNGRTWENTLNVSEGDNLPSIGFDNQGGVHVIWDNPAGSTLGRGHAWSTDGGRTWKKKERIFPGYRGQTWWPVMARDSAGTLHLIFAANPPTGSDPQLFHSEWQSDRWSSPELVSAGLTGGEGPSIAVSEGNKLNVAWFSYNAEDYGIWYTSAASSASPIVPRPLPSLTPVMPTALPSPTHSLGSAPAPSPVPLLPAATDATPPVRSPWLMIAIGIVPVVLIIAFVLAGRVARW